MNVEQYEQMNVSPVERLHNCTTETLMQSCGDLLVGVYGTLRSGERAHSMMEGMECINTVRVVGMSMYNIGAFPAIIFTNRGNYNPAGVVIEIYRGASHDHLKRLDMYEGFPSLYHRQVFNNSVYRSGLLALYTWGEPSSIDEEYERIESGDWVNRNNPPPHEPTDYGSLLRRAARHVRADPVEADVRLFS